MIKQKDLLENKFQTSPPPPIQPRFKMLQICSRVEKQYWNAYFMSIIFTFIAEIRTQQIIRRLVTQTGHVKTRSIRESSTKTYNLLIPQSPVYSKGRSTCQNTQTYKIQQTVIDNP